MVQLPDRISRLEELAHDVWWSWTPEARHLFRTLDYPLWRQTAHNPVLMLKLIPPEPLQRAAANAEWTASYDRVMARLDDVRSARNTWCEAECGELASRSIAYFSAEFALHQSLPIYAGGLGVLAGDHCKEASDLGVPLIGVGRRSAMRYYKWRYSVPSLLFLMRLTPVLI